MGGRSLKKVVSSLGVGRRILLSQSGSISVSTLNQTISSGANFLIGVYLARKIGPEQFGLYGIGFAVMLFFSGICNALLLVQMVVGFPSKTEQERDAYAASILVLLSGVFGCVLLLSLACVLAMKWMSVSTSFILMAAVVVGSSLACAFKDFFIRHSYSQRIEGRALAINICIAAVSLTGVVLVVNSHQTSASKAALALMVLGVAYLAGGTLGASLAKLPIRATTVPMLLEEARVAWRGGRWATSGAVVVWLQSQAYMYVTAIVLGPIGVGYANAAKLFITPFQFLMPAVSQLTLPRFAFMAQLEPLKLLRVAKWYTTAMITLACGYLALLFVSFDFVDGLLLKGKYQGLGWCVAAWGAVLVAQVWREGASTPLQAFRAFRSILINNFPGVALTLFFAWLLSVKYGAPGAVLSLAAGEVLFGYLLWRTLCRRSRQEPSLPEVLPACH